MKLTAIAGGSPDFEIFVIGDESASCDMLEKEFSDRFSEIEYDTHYNYETKTSFVGAVTHLQIGHPKITAACVMIWSPGRKR